ncbi:MAG: ORF6N domain-containing protein [Bacilli bacterium]|nr:ORF6N domain-containing protein [Bacilli bacterium]
MKNKIILLNEDELKGKIYTIRGKKVMLDSDLARIYGYSTKSFNQQIKNNIERFDDEYRFQLTNKEYNNLRSKNLTSSLSNNYGGRRTLPYVFTEEGIYMLISVLNGEKAVNQHKILIKTFKSMKDYLINNELIDNEYINNIQNIILEHNNRLIKLEDKISEYDHISKIFLNGEIYDAYSFILDLFNISENSITIIDNYIDNKLLDLLKNLKPSITVITKEDTLINKFKRQYSDIDFIIYNSFHDRFIVIDNEIVFSIGSSIKDIGKKVCYISRINNKEEINKLISKIHDIEYY